MLRYGSDGLCDAHGDRVKVERMEQILQTKASVRPIANPARERSAHLSILVNLQATYHRTRIERRHFGHVVVFTFTLFLLQFEGDATDGPALDTFHQMGCEARDFVAKAF